MRLVASLTLGAAVTASAGLARADLDPELTAFYEIREGTKNECVAVGSDGNILRWACTGGNEQKWLFVPRGDNRYHILTRSNGEHMAVGSNGNILRWGPTGGDEQVFRLLRVGDTDRYVIKEGTKDECVAVGSNGNVLRWGCTGGSEQEFRFLPTPVGDRPEPREGEAEPGQIGDVPRIEAFGELPPETSPPKLIGETVLPSVYVTDPKHTNAVEQTIHEPYYILAREQFWDRRPGKGAYLEHDGRTERKETVRTKVGFTQSESKSIEDTLSVVISTNATFNFTGGSAELGSKISRSLKVTTTSQTERMQEHEETREVTFPVGERFARTVWAMVDQYTLRRMDGSEVRSWDIVLDTIVEDGFPRK